MIEIGDSFKSKIKVLESIFFKVNIHNYEFLRMLSWHISKYYYKKAIEDETQKNDAQLAAVDNHKSLQYFLRYVELTKQIQQNKILSNANFLYLDPECLISG